ncbi:hypothetical protein Q5H93_07625 [Hymenobacter sp. ASUV-10]|uniref:Uncharacterized protein n=1 Tax=Hymenobacter aranciens TaxID=3063996 RepID=A0ABT9B8J6_9BACT|nr:hypothetical protein [Hymenobacter sp. ASUV-10]MDO7874597.1 hypothetical protein [Hymenobacter sp. ASUV-10]
MGYSSAGTNSLALNNVSGFSRWTLGNELLPLPVGLVVFHVERRGAGAPMRC